MSPAEISPACSSEGAEGVVLLELALLLPLLVLIAVCGMLMSGTFGGLQLTRSFSRELGIRAYRECSVENTKQPLTVQQPDACLRKIGEQFAQGAQKVAGSSEFALSIYTVSVVRTASGQIQRKAERTGYYTSGASRSAYSVADFNLSLLDSTESRSLIAFRKVVIAESFVKAENAPGSLYFLHSIVPFAPSEMLYAATIL